MLNYLTLSTKSKIEIPSTADGSTTVSCLDLLSNNIDVENHKINDCSMVEVTRDYIARPDLISLAVYGSDQYADAICKINGISNPFELNEGMILFIPDFSAITNMYIQASSSSVCLDDSENISVVKKNLQKTVNSRRSPNEQTFGDKTFIIDKQNKLVIY